MVRRRALLVVLGVFACGNEDPGEVYKTCEIDDECNTRLDECEHVVDSTLGMCTRSCQSAADCPSGDACVERSEDGFGPSCVKSCDVDADCPSAMTCFAHTPGALACFPSVWVE